MTDFFFLFLLLTLLEKYSEAAALEKEKKKLEWNDAFAYNRALFFGVYT